MLILAAIFVELKNGNVILLLLLMTVVVGAVCIFSFWWFTTPPTISPETKLRNAELAAEQKEKLAKERNTEAEAINKRITDEAELRRREAEEQQQPMPQP